MWERLSFFPMEATVLLAVVLGETFVITAAVALGLLSPVAAAAIRNGFLDPASYAVTVVVTVFFIGSLVAWSHLLGRAVERLVGKRWAKYALEIVAILFIVANGLLLSSPTIEDQTVLSAVNRLAPYLPTAPAVAIIRATVDKANIRVAACTALLFQFVAPLLLLRWIPIGSRGAFRRDTSDVRSRMQRRPQPFSAPMFRDRPLVVTMALCFHRELLREPAHVRYVVFVTVGMILIATFTDPNRGAAYDPEHLLTILTVGLLALAILISSLSLPLEKNNVVRLRLSSVAPSTLLAGKLGSSLILPVAFFAATAVAISVALSLDVIACLAYVMVGFSAVLVGGGIGFALGASAGSFEWSEPSRVYNSATRLFIAVPVVAGLFGGQVLISRLLGDLYTGAHGRFVVDSLIVLATALVVLLVAVRIAQRSFAHRNLDV